MNRLKSLIGFVLGCLCFGQDARLSPSRVRDLIRQLDEDSSVLRNRASEELESIGEEALPFLQEALNGGSAEKKGRVLQAIRGIQERAQLKSKLRPARLVTLEARNEAIQQVAESLGRQGDVRIELKDVEKGVTVSLSLSKVPFWEAIDRICRAGGLTLDDVEEGRLSLRRDPRIPPNRASGAFYVSLEKAAFDQNETGQRVGYSLDFLALWEKGVKPDAVRVRFDVVRDDRNADLLGEDRDPWAGISGSMFPGGRRLSFRSGRKVPAEPVKRIARLSGQVQFGFTLRTVSLSFKDPVRKVGQSETSEGMTVHLREFIDGDAVRGSFTIQAPDKIMIFSDLIQAEVIAASGKSHHIPMGDLQDGHLSVGFALEKGDGKVSELRVTLPLRLHVETVDFDFRDVPFH